MNDAIEDGTSQLGRRGDPWEFVFVGACYIGVAHLTSFFGAPELAAYLAFGIVAALLMIRKRRATRVISRLVLLWVIFGALHYTLSSRH